MEEPISKYFDSIESAISDIAEGKLVIVTDDENRENEGDLIMAASKVTPETVNMMIRYCSGIVCVPTAEHQLKRLGLNPMVANNKDSFRTDFTVSVDASEGITTGISAYDRTETIRIVGDPSSTPDMLVQPGHIFPLRARAGGVLERAGHTEAAVDLAILAGLNPSGVLCEIVNDDGTVARLPDLIKFKEKHGLKMISIAELIEYRHEREKLVERLATDIVNTEYGEFTLTVYHAKLSGRKHIVLTKGTLDDSPTLVRVQSSNVLGDVFAATDSKNKMSQDKALEAIAKEGKGVIVYIQNPDGGIRVGKDDKGKSKLLEPKMDAKDYGTGAQILADLGIAKIRLLTSQPKKVVALRGYGLEIVEQIGLLEE